MDQHNSGIRETWWEMPDGTEIDELFGRLTNGFHRSEITNKDFEKAIDDLLEERYKYKQVVKKFSHIIRSPEMSQGIENYCAAIRAFFDKWESEFTELFGNFRVKRQKVERLINVKVVDCEIGYISPIQTYSVMTLRELNAGAHGFWWYLPDTTPFNFCLDRLKNNPPLIENEEFKKAFQQLLEEHDRILKVLKLDKMVDKYELDKVHKMYDTVLNMFLSKWESEFMKLV